MSRSTSDVRRRSGFTLIELMLVVLIMGVIVSLAATRLDFLVPKYRLRGAARDVAALLRQGKARAAAQGRDLYFEADLSQSRYWLLAPFPKLEAGDDPKKIDGRPLEYQPVMERKLPEGVHFIDVILGDKEKSTTGRTRVRLSALGANSHVIVNLENDEHKIVGLRMNGFTGIIDFDDQHRDAEQLLEDRGL